VTLDRRPSRPGTAPRSPADQRRARKARNMRAWRQRDRANKCCVTVEIDAATLNMLVGLHWLDPRDADADDRRRIGEAIGALLTAAARGTN